MADLPRHRRLAGFDGRRGIGGFGVVRGRDKLVDSQRVFLGWTRCCTVFEGRHRRDRRANLLILAQSSFPLDCLLVWLEV